MFALSISAELLCIQGDVSEALYRLLYVRYIFAVAIGVFMAKYGFPLAVLLLSLLSLAYITLVSYFTMNIEYIYPSWGFQHAPAYFYTALIVVLLWNLQPYVRQLGISVNYIGRASYHIFLLQMFWFWTLSNRLQNVVQNSFVWLCMNILICIALGCLWFKIDQCVNGSLKWNCSNNLFQRTAKSRGR